MAQKVAFLDRDGVINIDHAYVHKIEDFSFVDGALDAARQLVDAGFTLVIVTNQSGIGRGYYTEEDFWQLTDWMKAEFAKAGAPIAAVYFCPHHPEKALEPYRMMCECRKPAPGMLLKAKDALDIDMAQSVMFGDKSSDMKAAIAAGVPTRILVGTDGKETPASIEEATFVAKDLADGINQLFGKNR